MANPKKRLSDLERKIRNKLNPVIIRVDWSTEEREPAEGETFVTWDDIEGEDEKPKQAD